MNSYIADSPLISVVIPSFNHGIYLEQAIKSVSDQTYENWELLIIDNNSADSTIEILDRISNPKIRVLRINNNGVIAMSRNLGIKNAKGSWIAFLDSDDWWEESKLNACAKYFSNETDLIYHDLEISVEENQRLSKNIIKSRKLKAPILLDLLINGNTIGNSSVVVRKSILEKVGLISEDYKMIGAEDFNTWLKISLVTQKFKHIPRILATYREHSQNISLRNSGATTHEAVREFLPLLTEKQTRRFDTNVSYVQGRTNYLENKYRLAVAPLLIVARRGFGQKKLKSIYMLLHISIYMLKK
jgi:glycosyltransferase involved in cell wall biosynthesis